MAAAAGVMMLVTHGILLTVGVFLQPIAQTTGIPFAQVYYLCFFSSISAAIVSLLLAPRLIAGLGPRKCFLIAVVLNTLHFLTLSITTTSPWTLYIGAAFGGVGMGIGGYACGNVFISSWFESRRSVVLGVVFGIVNMGIGGWQMLAGKLIEMFGFVVTHRIFAACVLVLGLLLGGLVIRSPQDLNEQPLRIGSGTADAPPAEETGPGKRAKRTVSFWLIFIALVLLAMSNSTYDNNVSSYVVSLGYSISTSGNVTGIRSVLVGLGSMAGGVILSKLGEKKTFLLIALCMCAAMIVISYAANTAMIWISMVLSASFGPCTSALIVALVTKNFGTRDLPNLIAVMSSNNLVSTMLMIFMSASIVTLTGSVRGAFLFMAVAVVVAAAFLLAGERLSPMNKLKRKG